MAKKKYHELFFNITCNEDQEKFKQAIMDDANQVVIADATAGAGKTYTTRHNVQFFPCL